MAARQSDAASDFSRMRSHPGLCGNYRRTIVQLLHDWTLPGESSKWAFQFIAAKVKLWRI